MTATYTANVSREGDWWLIDVPGIGVTQCADRDQAGAMAADLIAAVLDINPDDVHVSLVDVTS